MRKLFLLLPLLLLVECSQETIEPVLSPGNDTITLGSDYKPANCMLKTDSGTFQMMINEYTLDTSTVGETVITYSYEYNDKNYTCERKVFVIDETAPTVTLKENLDTIFVGDTWKDPGVLFHDNYSTNLTYSKEGSVNTDVVGTYTITYIVEDEFGNSTSIQRVVTVLEK